MINWKDSVNYRKEKTTQGIRYMITIDGEDVEVTEEVYKVYSSMERNERYQEEQKKEKVISLEAIAEDDMRLELIEIEFVKSAEDAFIDAEQERANDEFLCILPEALKQLEVNEQELVNAIYFDGIPLREYARRNNVTLRAIQKRRNTILKKLKNYFMKNINEG